MGVGRVASAFLTVAAFAGCSLFSDFGGFSEDPPASDAGADAIADVSSPDAPPADAASVDAGADGSPYRQAVLADSPVAYWPFDDAAGANVARDIIGGKNADVIGKLTFGVDGADGKAVERTAGGGSLEVGDHFDLAGHQAYSIEFWGWPKDTAEFGNVLNKRNEALNGWIVYFRDGTAVQIEHNSAAGQRTTFEDLPAPASRLHHIVFVFDPAQPTDKRQRVYIDSVRTDGFSDDEPADDVTTALTMLDYVGVLDEVAIYHHALTAERVAKHYELGAKRP